MGEPPLSGFGSAKETFMVSSDVTSESEMGLSTGLKGTEANSIKLI